MQKTSESLQESLPCVGYLLMFLVN